MNWKSDDKVSSGEVSSRRYRKYALNREVDGKHPLPEQTQEQVSRVVPSERSILIRPPFPSSPHSEKFAGNGTGIDCKDSVWGLDSKSMHRGGTIFLSSLKFDVQATGPWSIGGHQLGKVSI